MAVQMGIIFKEIFAVVVSVEIGFHFQTHGCFTDPLDHRKSDKLNHTVIDYFIIPSNINSYFQIGINTISGIGASLKVCQ